MRATAVLSIVLVAVLAAALRPDVAVSIAVGQERYRPGGSVVVRLHNRSSEPLGFNACTWTLERRGEIGWRPAPREEERRCTMELRTLAPGETARPEFVLRERLPAGRYRLRIALHRPDAGPRAVRRTGSFRIEP